LKCWVVKRSFGIIIADVVTLLQCGLGICKVCSVPPKNDQMTN